MFEFLQYLASGKLSPGEAELAYNLTVIYGLSILCMVVLHRLISAPPPSAQARPDTRWCSNLLRSRRSVMPKDLSGEAVTREEVETLLEAANWAPTHHRTEPWRFVVIEGSQGIQDYLDLVETWYEDNKEQIPEEEYSRFLSKVTSARSVWPRNVSHLILISMVRRALQDKELPEWEEISAVACSVQNLHLAVTSSPGLAGFWSSHTWCRRFRDSERMREFCGLADPEDRVFGCFVLGRVEEGREFRGSRRDWREKVTWK